MAWRRRPAVFGFALPPVTILAVSCVFTGSGALTLRGRVGRMFHPQPRGQPCHSAPCASHGCAQS